MKHAIKILIIPMLLTILCMAPALADDYQLPDTGIETCYDADGNEITCPAPGEPFYGQDAQYDSPKMAYQDNGDGTVTDLNTQLMWQQTDDGETRSWGGACDYCDTLELAGYSDWRIPDRRELFSIVDLERYVPAINTNYFIDTKSSFYWSGSRNACHSNDKWCVNFRYGNVNLNGCTYGRYVRCVRSGP